MRRRSEFSIAVLIADSGPYRAFKEGQEAHDNGYDELNIARFIGENLGMMGISNAQAFTRGYLSVSAR